MRKVLLTTLVPDEKTAWSKARADACAILRQAGYTVMALPPLSGPRSAARLWSSLSRELAGGGHILIEYPFGQRRRLYFLHLFRLLRLFSPVKLYALLHDIDSLRFETDPSRELAVLGLFDGLISHNPAMTRWLRDNGYTKKIVDLCMFDYLSESASAFHESGMSLPVRVVYAGNLNFAKATYIYGEAVGRLKNVSLSVFGPFFESDRAAPGAVTHKGVFDPSHPVLDGKYHFGLVWEGTSAQTCEGPYGRYLRYNNPHKASLYVSLGLPLVIWSGSAMAEFVADRGIGVAIDSLEELEQLPSRVDSEAYLAMVQRVQALRREIANGDFLLNATGRLASGYFSAPAIKRVKTS